MASLITRGDRANPKFYLQWRENKDSSNSTKLLVGVKTLRHATQIKAQFETARLSGKQGTHILFELGVGERPSDFVETVVTAEGEVVELPPPRAKLLLGPLLREWVDSLTNLNAREDRYKLEKHVLPYYENVPVKEAEDVMSALAYLDWLRPRLKASQSQRHCLGLVSRFFAWAIPRRLATVNPVKNIPQGKRPAPSGKADAPWLADALDLDSLREHLAEPLAIMFFLGNRSGLRPGEVAGLRMDDFDWLHEGIIRAAHSYDSVLKEDKNKAGKVKWVPAPDDADETVMPWLEKRRAEGAKKTDLVFPFSSVDGVYNARTGKRTHDPKTKAGFIRSLPIHMPAADVVERAKAAGHELSCEHVWVVRNQDRRAKEGKTKRGTEPERYGRQRGVSWLGFHQEYLSRKWREYRMAALKGAKITLYQGTRHSFASRHLAGDVPIDEVSAALNHSSTVVTKRFYDHFVRRHYSDKIRQGSKKKPKVNPPAGPAGQSG